MTVKFLSVKPRKWRTCLLFSVENAILFHHFSIEMYFDLFLVRNVRLIFISCVQCARVNARLFVITKNYPGLPREQYKCILPVWWINVWWRYVKNMQKKINFMPCHDLNPTHLMLCTEYKTKLGCQMTWTQDDREEKGRQKVSISHF